MENYYDVPEENQRRRRRRRSAPDYTCSYSIFHLIISFFAIYLSWYCNRKFDPMSFTVALFCPHLYIMYMLATRGGCGVFESTVVVR
jgi:hypothetical protein